MSTFSLADLTEETILQFCTPQVFDRGEDYYRRGAVTSLVRRGDVLQAEVEGSEYGPYRIAVTFGASGISDADCTCPYDWGGWCKHIAAALLACLHEPEAVEEQPSLQPLLAALDRDQLQTVLLKLAARDPDVADDTAAQVAVLASLAQPSRQAEQAATVASPSIERSGSTLAFSTPIDPRPFRQQVRAALRSLDRMRASEAYWHVRGVVDEVRRVLDEEALRIAEHSLTLDGFKISLAIWLRDAAGGLDKTDLAAHPAVVAARESRTLADYRRVQEMAGDRWPELREALLEHLRRAQTHDMTGPVEIFLHEHLINDALAAVKGSWDYSLIGRVVDAAIESRPDQVIPICRKQTEEIMDGGKSGCYEQAVRWLKRAKAAYQAAERVAEWETYLDKLFNRHQKKYKLKPMLQALRN